MAKVMMLSTLAMHRALFSPPMFTRALVFTDGLRAVLGTLRSTSWLSRCSHRPSPRQSHTSTHRLQLLTACLRRSVWAKERDSGRDSTTVTDFRTLHCIHDGETLLRFKQFCSTSLVGMILARGTTACTSTKNRRFRTTPFFTTRTSLISVTLF